MPSEPPRETTAPDAPFSWLQEVSPRSTPLLSPQMAQAASQLAGKAGQMAQRALLWLGIWLLLGLASVVLLILGITGHGYAWGLLLLLIFGSVAALWVQLQAVGRQAGRWGKQYLGQVQGEAATGLSAGTQTRIAALEQLLRRSHLTPPLQQRLEQAVHATRAALLSTAETGLMTREAHEAHTAAEQDIPEALAAYERLARAGGSLSYGEVLLSEQLQLIEARMHQIVQLRRHEQARDLEAGRRYLQDKYRESEAVSKD